MIHQKEVYRLDSVNLGRLLECKAERERGCSLIEPCLSMLWIRCAIKRNVLNVKSLDQEGTRLVGIITFEFSGQLSCIKGYF